MKLKFKVLVPESKAFECLSDMQKFCKINPVIHKIKWSKDQDYLIYETLKLGPLPYSFVYPVNIQINTKLKCIDMRATVMKLIKINLRFEISTISNITNIDETIDVRAFFPLKWLIQRILKTQHSIMFLNLEKQYALELND